MPPQPSKELAIVELVLYEEVLGMIRLKDQLTGAIYSASERTKNIKASEMKWGHTYKCLVSIDPNHIWVASVI